MKLIDILVEETIENGWSWPEHANCITQDRDREIMPAKCQPSVAKFEASFNRWFLDGSRIDCFTADVLASDYAIAIITREQYEAALAAKNDGWIEWGGGEYPPVSTNAVVDVKLRCGSITARQPAGAMNWQVNAQGDPGDIIAYRLHQPQEADRVRAAAWNAYAGITEADEEANLNECIGQDAAPVWNGEGLPPVGCECEFMKHTLDAIPNWRRGIIKYVSEYTVVIVEALSPGEFVAHPRTCDFRPVPSEAERKRDEAKIAIAELCRSSASNGHSADLIFDAIAAGKIPGVKLED
jgi:hypothetical protein